MSLQMMIMNLISGIRDPTTRIDIASTIHYLFDIYAGGHANEGDIRNSIFDICRDVLRFKFPDLTEDEIREKAGEMTEEFMRVFRLESARRRVMSRIRPRFGLTV